MLKIDTGKAELTPTLNTLTLAKTELTLFGSGQSYRDLERPTGCPRITQTRILQ